MPQVEYEKSISYQLDKAKCIGRKQQKHRVTKMLNSLRKRYRRTRSVNEYDLQHSNNDSHKSRFSMFSRKANCRHQVTSAYSTQRVHSEHTRRKYGSGLQLNRSKSNSIRNKLSYGAISRTDSNTSWGSQDLDFVSSSKRLSGDESVSQYESGSVSSPGTPRRLAICTELEKDTFMDNGESLLIGHRNLVARGYLESYAYI